MSGLNRRAFLAVSAGGLAALHGEGGALAALHRNRILPSILQDADSSNALNLGLFLKNKDTLGLTGVMSTRPVASAFGGHAPATLFLFPFQRSASNPDVQAFLPARNAAGALIATVAMTPAGLPPDEYYCNYVLKAPRHSFIGFSVETPGARGMEERPWCTHVDVVGNSRVDIGWTSSNLNHPWFKGSHWIPDGEDRDGRHWRAWIIAGVRQALALAC